MFEMDMPPHWRYSWLVQNSVDPIITIAVPSLNQGRYLSECLHSILAQDLPVEIMLADAGSRDETKSVIKNFENHLAWWRSAPDAGQGDAVNEALAWGRAPYVAWLNADDVWHSGALKNLLRGLEENPDADVAYARAEFVNSDGVSMGAYPSQPSFDPNALARRCFISQPATLIRRSAWERVNGLNTNLHYALDYDLWWRLHRTGSRFIFVDHSAAQMRVHALAKTWANPAAHYSEAMAVVREHYGRLPVKWYAGMIYSVLPRMLMSITKKCWQKDFSNAA